MKQSKTVKRLILENNHIHMRGAQALADALMPEEGKASARTRHGMRAICCRRAADASCRFLPQDDPPLEMLSLRNNSIGYEGATAIATVRKNTLAHDMRLHIHDGALCRDR